MREEIIFTKDREETIKLGERIAKDFKYGGVLALFGNLGSGKTTFVQGFAKGLGIKQRIISPTFIIVRTYKLEVKNFYHIDLYRIETQKDIHGLGLEEVLNNSQNIVTIEWAEKIRDLLPEKRIDINFEYVSENKRRIRIKKHG